jgi:hypothetical protein
MCAHIDNSDLVHFLSVGVFIVRTSCSLVVLSSVTGCPYIWAFLDILRVLLSRYTLQPLSLLFFLPSSLSGSNVSSFSYPITGPTEKPHLLLRSHLRACLPATMSAAMCPITPSIPAPIAERHITPRPATVKRYSPPNIILTAPHINLFSCSHSLCQG